MGGAWGRSGEVLVLFIFIFNLFMYNLNYISLIEDSKADQAASPFAINLIEGIPTRTVQRTTPPSPSITFLTDSSK